MLPWKERASLLCLDDIHLSYFKAWPRSSNNFKMIFLSHETNSRNISYYWFSEGELKLKKSLCIKLRIKYLRYLTCFYWKFAALAWNRRCKFVRRFKILALSLSLFLVDVSFWSKKIEWLFSVFLCFNDDCTYIPTNLHTANPVLYLRYLYQWTS